MSKVILLDPGFPLQRSQEIDPETIVSGTPNEKVASYAKVGNLDVGLWESEPYEERIRDYPVDEVMIIISSGAVMTDLDGNATELKAGDVAYVPKGWSGTWKQTETIRKYTVMVSS